MQAILTSQPNHDLPSVRRRAAATRFCNVLFCATLALLAMAAQAVAAPSQVLFGATRLELSSEFLQALGAARIAVVGSRPGTFVSGSPGAYLGFPIPAGRIDVGAALLELSHRGGVELRIADRGIELRDLVIERRGSRAMVAARIAGQSARHDRLPLFDIVLDGAVGIEPAAASTAPSRLTVAAAPLMLAGEAAARLNEVLGVEAFTGAMAVGTVHVSAYVANAPPSPVPAG